jgi:hypothetical protein
MTTQWTPIVYRMKNILYECIVTTHKANGSESYTVAYNVNFQGKFFRLHESDIFLTETNFSDKVRKRIPLITNEEVKELWDKKEQLGLGFY